MDKEFSLKLQEKHFERLVLTYYGLGVPNDEIIRNLAAFVGKFSFDNACCYKNAETLLNEGVGVGRLWSIDAYENEEDFLDR